MADVLTIKQGKTFSLVLRWSAEPYITKLITAITRAAPARITAAAHGMPDGWRAAVVSAGGMRQINAENYPPKDGEYRKVTKIDADTITLPHVNSTDYTAYTSGGYLHYLTPVSLASCTARLTIRDKVGGTALISLDSASLGGIALDNTAKTITITLSATVTAALTWTRGVFELEIQNGSGVVTQLLYGTVIVKPLEIVT